jgi:anti-sigma B factor antagonist
MIFTRDEGADQAHATLVLSGEIDMASAPALRHLADNLPLRDLQRLTLDMGDVRFMDSTGIGFLVALRKRMPPGSELAVVNPAPTVARVLQVTGLDSIVGLAAAPVPRPRSLPDSDTLDPTG